MSDPSKEMDVVALRPFLPANDYQTSYQFYVDLGFEARPLGDNFASMRIGNFGFLLQKYNAESYAQHLVMHMTVRDLNAWWKRIAGLDLGRRYGVRAPSEPKMQPWGLVVSYVVDPTGILWHIAQDRG